MYYEVTKQDKAATKFIAKLYDVEIHHSVKVDLGQHEVETGIIRLGIKFINKQSYYKALFHELAHALARRTGDYEAYHTRHKAKNSRLMEGLPLALEALYHLEAEVYIDTVASFFRIKT